MIQSVEVVPPPAVEVTMALTQRELRHLEEIAPRLWEERHLLKIPLRKINLVEAYLNKLPLQAKERNCIVKGSNKACQDQDLTARWKRAAEEKQRLTVQTLQLDPEPTQRPLGRAPDHPKKREVGQWRRTGLFPVDNEARLDQQREGHQVAKQLLKEEPRRISSGQKINLMPRHSNLAFIFFVSRVNNPGWKVNSKIRLSLSEAGARKLAHPAASDVSEISEFRINLILFSLNILKLELILIWISWNGKNQKNA
jgi:hypothetical protein